MLPLVVAALFSTAPAPEPVAAVAPVAPVPPAARDRHPALLRDAAFAAAASAAVAMAKADIRHALLHDGRLSNVIENFAHPVSQVRAGTRRDTDPFWVNGIAHPASFALEALYLRRRGYGRGAAFLFTQVHSVVWEFAVEGCAFEPSGKDLLTDAAGAAAAIWVLDPLLRRAGLGTRPGRKPPVTLTVVPAPPGARLRLAATF